MQKSPNFYLFLFTWTIFCIIFYFVAFTFKPQLSFVCPRFQFPFKLEFFSTPRPSHSVNISPRNESISTSATTFENGDQASDKKDTNILSSSTKLILLYTPWYGNAWGEQNSSQAKTKLHPINIPCSQKCVYTRNRDYLDRADVVAISIQDLVDHPMEQRHLERPRTPSQIWIGLIFESPQYFTVSQALNSPKLDSMFNLTFTYRPDSDISLYANFFQRKNHSSSSVNHPVSSPDVKTLRKKKLVAWLVSHCITRGDRERLVTQMQKYIPVDIYGRCGPLKCPTGPGVVPECRADLGKEYKFYLAFENSLCWNYVTEKFYEPYKFDMIPIVYGFANYENLGPPGSFINILDFTSIKALTDYLIYLDNNDGEYMKYFRWKREFFIPPPINFVCRMCLELWKSPKRAPKSVPSFTQWWQQDPPSNSAREFDPYTQFSFINYTGRVCLIPTFFFL